MKKILIFSLAYYPRVGGAEVAIKEITDRVPDIEWHLITMRFSARDAREEKIGKVIVHRVGSGSSYISKILFVPDAAAAAIQLHKRFQFDGAWAMMSYMTLPLMLMRIFGVRLPYVLTLQEGDSEHHMFGRLRILPFLWLVKKGFRNASAVSAISTYLANWARHLGYRGAVEVIPNGADIEKFRGDPIAHRGTVLITTSRLVHKNAIDDVIRALPMLPNVRFQILGNGPDEWMLKKLAKDLQVDDRVEFAGHVDHARMPPFLHAADIFIRPSRSEGMGSSFIEAMAAGLPVIATQEGGLADFIKPQETAWVVVKDEPKQIAEAVKDILANPEEVKKVTENAKKMVEDKYDWSIIARDMRERVFSKL